jgi:hypothetical protein
MSEYLQVRNVTEEGLGRFKAYIFGSGHIPGREK